MRRNVNPERQRAVFLAAETAYAVYRRKSSGTEVARARAWLLAEINYQKLFDVHVLQPPEGRSSDASDVALWLALAEAAKGWRTKHFYDVFRPIKTIL